MSFRERQRVLTNLGKGSVISVADGYLFVELDSPVFEYGNPIRKKMINSVLCLDACQCWGLDCENQIPEVELCCDGTDCACMGMPVHAPFCSQKCEQGWAEHQRKLREQVEEYNNEELLF